MKKHNKISNYLFFFKEDAKDFFKKMKRQIWNRRILLGWNRLYIRKDEFHSSTDLDIEAMMEMNKQETKEYITDIMRRRDIAHQRDLEFK